MSKPTDKAAGVRRDGITVRQRPGQPDGEALAETVVGGGGVRHGQAINSWLKPFLDGSGATLELMELADLTDRRAALAASGDLGFASAMLAAQATTLDTMFTELSRRSGMNLAKHIDAGERFARLAMKAQSNCRATLETLAKLHQPREQTVRHVHVNEGGQAIVADNFHHHAGGMQNAESAEQSHATGPADQSAALPRPDAGRDALPIASGVGKAALPNARRD